MVKPYLFFGARAELFGSDYFFWSQSRTFWLCLFFFEPEPNFLALIIFFGARAELFGSDIFFGARAELFGSGYFFLEPEPGFWL